MHVVSGLGDRILDSIGFTVVSEMLGRVPMVNWDAGNTGHNNARGRSSYSLDEFGPFPWSQHETHETPYISLYTNVAGIALCPDAVIRIIQDDDREALVGKYIEIAEKITPSPRVDACIPRDMSRAIGVHLRKSDKITQARDNASAHEVSVNEFETTLSALREYIVKEFIKGTTFFVCSEDAAHKSEFEGYLTGLGHRVIDVGVSGGVSRDVVDFFALSRCREILQGIKYSTFSMTAAIIGRKPLRNFSDFSKSLNMMNYWAPLLVNVPRDYDWSSNPYKADMDRAYILSDDMATRLGLFSQKKRSRIL